MKKRLIIYALILSFVLSVCNFPLISYADGSTLLSYTFEAEEDWSYWSSTGANNTYTVTDAYANGEKSLFLCDTSSTAGTGIKSGYFSVTAGETYTLVASFYVVKLRIRAYLKFYDANKSEISSGGTTATVKNSWEERVYTAAAPADAVYARVIICTDNSDISGGYVDDVSVVTGEVTAKGTFTGTTPETLPSIDEETEDVEIVDDGYTEGQIIYSESFENSDTSLSGWAAYNDEACYSIKNEMATDGNYSLYIKDDSASLGKGAFSDKFKVAQGNTYTVYTDIYNRVTGISLYFRFYNSSGTQLLQTATTFTATGWLNGRVSAVAPEGAVTARVLYAGSSVGTGEAYYDNLRVYKGNVIKRHGEYELTAPLQNDAQSSQIISESDGKLIYNTYNEKGDTLSDFSYAGFYGGELDLPDTDKLSVYAYLSPSGTGDDTALIQAAIDGASSTFSGQGMKVVKLKAGTYYINSDGLELKSGVVLSGEGQGPTGTVLYAKDAVSYNVIEAFGSDPIKTTGNILITDDYVKSGSREINVSDASSFNVGDTIRIVHPSSDEWIIAMEMKDISTVYGNVVSWEEGTLDNKTERKITAIDGNKITLNYGLFIPYDKQYAQSYIYATDDTGYLRDTGVENLRVQSYFNGDPLDLNHAKMAIYVKRVKNMFIKNVTAKNMYNGVFGCRVTNRITVLNCSNIDPVSTVVGGNRYPFYADVDSEQILFSGCYSYDGRHDYMAVKGTSGPVVFSDSVADMSNAASETHAGFATGVLYDNIFEINDRGNGYIAMANRGYYGTDTPQGWTAGGCVVWNSLANSIIVNKPPLTYQNFMVGIWGTYNNETSAEVKASQLTGYKDTAYRTTSLTSGPDSAFATSDGTSLIGDAYRESEFNPVNPRSLYKAQLAERFTGNISNAKPNAPVIVYPRPDKELSSSESKVEISGFYQKGASKVNIYVDDVKYNASLNSATSEFSLSITLASGTHKIYATQTIDDVEGNKTADRFITIENAGSENYSYLSSNYDKEITSAITNDTRKTYDEEVYGINITDISYNSEDNSYYITFTPSVCDTLTQYVVSMEGAEDTVILDLNDEGIYKLSDISGKISDVYVSAYDGDGDIFETSYPYTFDFSYTQGEGTEENPYIITSAKQFAGLFGKESTADMSAVYLLTGFDEEALTLPSTYKPSGEAFTGKLSGGNISDGVITDIRQKIHISSSPSATDYIKISSTFCQGALFHILDGATVKNLSLSGTALSETDISGISCFGTVCGYLSNSSVLENIDTSVTVTSAQTHGTGGLCGMSGGGTNTITDCVNYGNIVCSEGYVGGIIGDKFRTEMTNCKNYGEITGLSYTGGLVGQNKNNTADDISLCANYGLVTATEGFAGGIAGASRKDISLSYNTGNITAKTYAGSIIGYIPVNYTANVTNCFNTGIVSGEEASGIVTGSLSGTSAITAFYDTLNSSVTSATGLNSGTMTCTSVFSYGTPKENENDVTKVNDESLRALTETNTDFANTDIWTLTDDFPYPNLVSNIYVYDGEDYFGSGTLSDPYRITNASQFVSIFGEDSTADMTAVYLLTGFDETPLILPSDFVPYKGEFSGMLLGGNMSGGTIEAVKQKIQLSSALGTDDHYNNYAGALFHRLNNATVENLALYGEVRSADIPSATSYFGTLAGYLAGSCVIDNVDNYASVTSSQDYATGGLIGSSGQGSHTLIRLNNYGTVTGKKNTAGIIGDKFRAVMTECCNYGTVTGTTQVGGLVGENKSTSSVDDTIRQCENYGTVTATGGYAGGIAGRTRKSIEECFNMGNVSATTYAGAIVGQVAANYTVNINNCYNFGIIYGESGTGLVSGDTAGTATVRGFFDAANPDVYNTSGNTSGTLTVTSVYSYGENNGNTLGDTVKISFDELSTLTSSDEVFENTDVWTATEDYMYPDLKNNIHNRPFTGLGTEEIPYRIYSLPELKNIDKYYEWCYTLMNDIGGADTPLCRENSFSGSFDGNGRTITISIDDEANSEHPKYVGLFAKAKGKISNLTISGVLNAGWVNYQGGVGAFVGSAEQGFEITDCKNYATVTSTGHQTAGIVGRASGNVTIKNCYNYGSVTAGEKASGIAGLLNQKGTGDNTTYPVISDCGNYGNVTGGSAASGICSWTYAKDLGGFFNIGTIRATKSGGVATGLFGNLENTGTAVYNSYNAGNLFGYKTYGISYMNSSDTSNEYTITNCYNAVYADYPITLNGIATVENCYYLSDTKSGDFGENVSKSELTGIFEESEVFVIVNNYKYPQLKDNLLDTEYDNFDIFTLTITDNTEYSTVKAGAHFDKEMYVRGGVNLILTVIPKNCFYAADVSKNDLTVCEKIDSETEVYILIDSDCLVEISDSVISPTVPDGITASTWVFNSLIEEEEVVVDGVTYERCAVIASRADKIYGLKLDEFGIFIGDSEDNCNIRLPGDPLRISSEGAYGILVYSKEDDTNGLKDNVTYYVVPYAVYTDIDGNTHTLNGETSTFVFEK